MAHAESHTMLLLSVRLNVKTELAGSWAMQLKDDHEVVAAAARAFLALALAQYLNLTCEHGVC
jgi:hypothetical protein